MSQSNPYLVSYLDSIPLKHLITLGVVSYRHYPFFCLEHSEQEHIELLIEEYKNVPVLISTLDGVAVAAMGITNQSRDLHVNGVGRDIIYMIVHPEHKRAMFQLKKLFLKQLKIENSDWYSITNKISQDKYLTEVRRLNGKESRKRIE